MAALQPSRSTRRRAQEVPRPKAQDWPRSDDMGRRFAADPRPLAKAGPARTYRIFERKLFVRSCCGFVKKCSGVPSSMIRPSSIITIRSATSRAKPIS